MAFGLEKSGSRIRLMAGRAEEALHGAGIEHLAGRPARTLSGGERQRVALASCLVMRPSLVVLDGPTSQLDPEGAALVLASLTRTVAEGHSVVISEHRLDRLLKAATKLVLVEGGRVESVDPATWRPPSVAIPPSRTWPAGSEVWSLDGMTAGFNGKPVVEDVKLNGRSGVVVLNGPNGGGKTTLLRRIAGAILPLAGRVERRPGRIGYLTQNPTALLPGRPCAPR